MFLCIPIIFGINDRIKPNKDFQPLACPRCHNTSVIYARNCKWFELFFIPLIPVYWKHIYLCNICGWRSQNSPPPGSSVPLTTTRADASVLPPYTGGWEEPNHPGYQPAYLAPPYSESETEAQAPIKPPQPPKA
ncbi:hypothetical protein CC2G_005810 [Coprinopsis cinerea AmutBmut pab1-1]|nr:hypothetical protein CC2G_005810 [Coprinopsis cinerea AmutBmut pab1-1]